MQKSIEKYMELTKDRNSGVECEQHMQVIGSLVQDCRIY